MNRMLFSTWANLVKAKVDKDICEGIYVTGEAPAAIIAGGEYQYVFMTDHEEIQLTTDGNTLWRGVPLFRCGRVNGVKVVWAMEDVEVPEPPKAEETT